MSRYNFVPHEKFDIEKKPRTKNGTRLSEKHLFYSIIKHFHFQCRHQPFHLAYGFYVSEFRKR